MLDVPGKYLDKEDACFWIATQPGENDQPKEKIVGCVALLPYDWDKNLLKLKKVNNELGKVAELTRLTVAAEIRRKGNGKKLLEKAIEFSKLKNYDNLVVKVFANNVAAISLLVKYGFKFHKRNFTDFGYVPVEECVYVLKLK